MKNLTKFALFAALCGVFVGCGGDSGSNSSGSELPESIKNFSDIADYDCNDARQCAKLYIEEYDDYMQCVNGVWETLISSMKNSCSDVAGSSSKNENSSSSIESSSSEVSSSSVVKGTMTDERDGKIYKTVTIGKQTWMAENLNYAYNVATSTEDSSSFCYENESDSCAKYGRLYLWSAAMDSTAMFSEDGKGCGYDTTCNASGTVRGVCPEGWHLPSDNEWDKLITAVGGSAGTKLKSTSGWYSSGNGEDSYNGGNGKDSYGFSVLPAGYRQDNGGFRGAGYFEAFWSSTERSTELNSYYAYAWQFYYPNASVFWGGYGKDEAISVRCVRDSN